MNHTHIEENKRHEQGSSQRKHQHLHGDVLLMALHLHILVLALESLAGQTHCTLNHTPLLDDADDATHGDATNADVTRAVLENLVGRRGCHVGIHTHERNNNPPDECTAGKDDERITQAHNVAQAHDSRTGVDFKHHLQVVGHMLQGRNGCSGKHFFPPAECG